MTWPQIVKIVFHERDEYGRIVWKHAPERYTDDDAFRDRWREWGLRDDEIDKKYQEFWIIEGYRESLEKQKLGENEIERRVAKYRDEVSRNRKWGR